MKLILSTTWANEQNAIMLHQDADSMILSGEHVKAIISSALDKSVQEQPASFDLTVGGIASLEGTAALDFDNSERVLPKEKELTPNEDGWFVIQPGSYLVSYGEAVAIPENAAGIVLPRSSLMRMGATVISALWDPGYSGRGKGLLIASHPLKLKKRARVAQLVLFRTEGVNTQYSGQYQHEALTDKDF